jgi:uncharacterized protein (DUF2344 family)
LTDIWLNENPEPEALATMLAPSLPPGIRVESITELEYSSPKLQTEIISAEYVVLLDANSQVSDLEERVAALLAEEKIMRVRRKKEYDLRILIEELSVQNDGDVQILTMQLSSRPGATGRPEEVLLAIDLDPLDALIERTGLILAE